MSDSEDEDLSPSEMPYKGTSDFSDDDDDDGDDNGPSTSWGLKKRKRPIISDSDDDDDDVAEETLKDEGDSCDSDSSDGAPGAETCAICLGRMRSEVGSPDTCEHTFCEFCILEWSKNNPTCPQDRIPFAFVFVRNLLGGQIVRKVPVKKKEKEILEIDLTLENPTYCEVCNECNREERLLLCDGCDLGYHLECLDPPLSQVPVEEWFCPVCTAANVPQVITNRRRGSNASAVAVRDRRGSSQSRRLQQQPDTPRIPRTRATERIRARIQRKKIKKRLRRKKQRANKRVKIESGEIEDKRPPVKVLTQLSVFGKEDPDVDAEHKEDRYAEQFLTGGSVEAARHPAQRRAEAVRHLRDVAFIPQSSYAGRAKNRVLEIVNTQSEGNQTDLLSGILENQTIAFTSSKNLLLTNDRKLTKQPGIEIPCKIVENEDFFVPEPLPSQRKSPEKSEMVGSSSGEQSTQDTSRNKDGYDTSSSHSCSRSNEGKQRSPSSSTFQHPFDLKREWRKDYSHGSYKRDDYHNRRQRDFDRNGPHSRRHDDSYRSKYSSYGRNSYSSWQNKNPRDSPSYGRYDKDSHRRHVSPERKYGSHQSRDRSPCDKRSSTYRKGREERCRSPNSKYDKRSHENRSYHHSKSRFSESKGKCSLSSVSGEKPLRSQWSYNYFNSDNLFSKSSGSNVSTCSSSLNFVNGSKLEAVKASESESHKRPEIEGNRRPENEGSTRAESEGYKKLEIEGNRKPENEGYIRRESEGHKRRDSEENWRPESEENRMPESADNRNPESEENKKLESKCYKRPKSEENRRPESDGNRKPESEGYKRPKSEENRGPESEGHRKPEIEGYKRQKSEENRRPEFEKNRKLESEGYKRPKIKENMRPKSEGNRKPKGEGYRRSKCEENRRAEGEVKKRSENGGIIGKLVPVKTDTDTRSTTLNGVYNSIEDETREAHKAGRKHSDHESSTEEEEKLQKKNALLERVKKLVEKCQTDNFDFDTSMNFDKDVERENFGLLLKKSEKTYIPESCSDDVKELEVDVMQFNYSLDKVNVEETEGKGKSSPKSPLSRKTKLVSLFGDPNENMHLDEDGINYKGKDKDRKSSKKLKSKNLFGNDSDDESRPNCTLHSKHEASGAESNSSIPQKVNERNIGHHHSDMKKIDAHGTHGKATCEKKPHEKCTPSIPIKEVGEKLFNDKKSYYSKHSNPVSEKVCAKENTSNKQMKDISDRKYHSEKNISSKLNNEMFEKRLHDENASQVNAKVVSEKSLKEKVCSMKEEGSDKRHDGKDTSTKHGNGICEKKLPEETSKKDTKSFSEKVFKGKDSLSKLGKEVSEKKLYIEKNDAAQKSNEVGDKIDHHKKEVTVKHGKGGASMDNLEESFFRKDEVNKKCHDKQSSCGSQSKASSSLFCDESTNPHEKYNSSKKMKIETNDKKTIEMLSSDDEYQISKKSDCSKSRSNKVNHKIIDSSLKYNDIRVGAAKSKQVDSKLTENRQTVKGKSYNSKRKSSDRALYSDLFGDIDDINSSSNSNLPEVESKPKDVELMKATVEDEDLSFVGIICNKNVYEDKLVEVNSYKLNSTLNASSVEHGNHTHRKDTGNEGYSISYKERPVSKIENEQRTKQQKAALEIKVVQEVKKSLDPYYRNKSITKEEYKQIVSKCVKKVVNAECGDVIEPEKMHGLVMGYIKLYKHRQMKSQT